MLENDPGLELNCPRCGKRLQYQSSGSSGAGAYNPHADQKFNVKVDTHYYRCPDHGPYHIGPDGRLNPGP